MMKRILLLSCLAFLLLAGGTQAQTATLDGITYTVNEDGQTASVTGYAGEPVDVAIPATVNINGTGYAVTAIGDQAFYGCTSLQSIALPESLRRIGGYAFRGCTALESLALPEEMDEIGNWAFVECTSLAGLTLPERLGEIGSYAFSGCTAIESIAFPEGLPGTGNGTFDGCTALQSVALPEGMEEIGSYAFAGCTALAAITLPSTTVEINNNAFAGCTSLASVALPERLSVISSQAFYGCTALQSIALPEGLAHVDNGAFVESGLLDVHALATTPPYAHNDAFDADIYARAALHVPSGAEEAYREAQGWKNFLNIGASLPPVSIDGVAADESLATYANGILTLSGMGDVTVYGQNGAQVRHAAGVASLSLEGLPHGLYIICVAQGGQRQVLKVVL